MSNERRHKIIAIGVNALFDAIQAGKVTFNHNMPKGTTCRSCKYDFRTNEVMFLIEHESFELLHAGMIPPMYRIEPEE